MHKHSAHALAATSLLLSACANTTDQPPATPTLGMANPASVFCQQQGGTSRIVTTPQGQHSICVLPDGREIEEWALYRQHHSTSKP